MQKTFGQNYGDDAVKISANFSLLYRVLANGYNSRL